MLIIVGSVFLIAAALVGSFGAVKRRTGLPPKGVLELALVRTVNGVTNGAGTLLSSLMFGATILVLFAALPSVWSTVGIVALVQGGFGFILDPMHDTQLVLQVLTGVFLFSLFWCSTFLIMELTDPDRTPPFSILKFDREKFS